MSSYQYFLNAACLRQSTTSCIDGKDFLTSPVVPTGSLYSRCAPSSIDYYSQGRGDSQQHSYMHQHQQQEHISSSAISPQSPNGYQLGAADLKSSSLRGSNIGLSIADQLFQERAVASAGFGDLLQQQQQHHHPLMTSSRTGNSGSSGVQYGQSSTPTPTAVSSSGRHYGNNNISDTVAGYALHGPPTAGKTRCSSPSLSPNVIKPMIIPDENSSGALSPPLSESSCQGSVGSSDYDSGPHHRGGLQSMGSNGVGGGPTTVVEDMKASSVGSASNSSSNESSNGGQASSGGSRTATSGARTPSINEPTIYPWMRRVHSGHGGTL